MPVHRHILPLLLAAVALLMTSCMEWDYDSTEEMSASASGLFIMNEGNFQYGNATLSYYDPATMEVQNEVFRRANGMKLGDVAQSMTIYDGRGWVVVNNSHVVFAIDTDTFRELGRITDLTSPRYIHFVSSQKAYVSQMWDNRIFIVDPQRYEVTGYIEVPDMTMETGSTEQMVQVGRYVYCTCWSYQNRVIKIDTLTDTIVGQLTVGLQPNSIVVDGRGRLWVLTDGGYEGSPYGYEAPSLCCIDTDSFTIEAEYSFKLGSSPSELQISADGSTLYWLNDDVWSMNMTATHLPIRPLLKSRGTKYYGLSVHPLSGDIYVADAIDYQQQGKVYRYSSDGTLTDEFYVGIIPGAFCWKFN
jgi:sugar lactone lactonase YvrE